MERQFVSFGSECSSGFQGKINQRVVIKKFWKWKREGPKSQENLLTSILEDPSKLTARKKCTQNSPKMAVFILLQRC